MATLGKLEQKGNIISLLTGFAQLSGPDQRRGRNMRKGKARFADLDPGDTSPLDYAVIARDRSTVAMVAAALRHRETMLAFQPVVQSPRPDRIAF